MNPLVIVFVPVFLVILITFYRLFTGTFSFLLFSLAGRNPFKYFAFRYHDLPPQQVRYLDSFDYYQTMPDALRRIFRHRVSLFIREKKFKSPEDFEVTDEMKTLIAASAVQVTFGMTCFMFKRYPSIIIYPESYFSSLTGEYHLGEVNPGGAIVLSWKDFQKGYDIPHDNRNLGLHEFAHALFLNVVGGKDEDLRLTFHYDEFMTAGDAEFFKMRKTKEGYLRSYAATNMMEFFAVSVEHFFEAPNAMKEALPDLYLSMKKILGQDPTKWIKA